MPRRRTTDTPATKPAAKGAANRRPLHAPESRYEALLEQRAKLDRQIEAARAEESARDLETVKSLIARWGLTAFECGFVKTQLIPPARAKKSERTFAAQEPKAAPAPKYVNPDTGATWSGRGPQPKWMTGPRDEYLIANAEARPNQEARPAMTH